MFRNIIFYLSFFPLTVFFSITAALGGLLFPRSRIPWLSGKYWSIPSLRAAGIPVEADIQALNEGQAYIFMPNHHSHLDILILYAVLHRFPIGFVAKESLFHIPVFGKALLAAGHVPIDRANIRRAMKSIDEAVARARGGSSIVVFPEGTRQKQFESLAEFHIGGVVLALRSGLPVAPVLISGSGEILPKGSRLLAKGKRLVRVKALPPLATGSVAMKNRDAFKNDLYAMMNAAYKELKG